METKKQKEAIKRWDKAHAALEKATDELDIAMETYLAAKEEWYKAEDNSDKVFGPK